MASKACSRQCLACGGCLGTDDGLDERVDGNPWLGSNVAQLRRADRLLTLGIPFQGCCGLCLQPGPECVFGIFSEILPLLALWLLHRTWMVDKGLGSPLA